MKALLCHEFSSIENVQLANCPIPQPQANEVLVQVAACGLNYPDILILENKYQFQPQLPFSPGGEISGVVMAVGSGVENVEIGQRVFAIERWGGLSEFMCIPADRISKLPESVGFLDASSTIYNFSTAYYALKNRGQLKPGEVVLILGASGGVGLAAIQLAKTWGAVVIAVSSSDQKLETCKNFGAKHLINSATEDLRERIKEITNNKGVGVILDIIGSETAIRNIANGGRYLVVGFASGQIPKVPLNLALLKSCDIRGVFWGKFSREEPHKQLENTEDIFSMLSKGQVKPYIEKTFTLDQAKEALEYFKNSERCGKVVVVCNETLVNQAPQEYTNPKYIFTSKTHILESVGRELGESQWFQITQSIINDFAASTDDYQWIHVNPEKAKKSSAGTTIAHGFLTISLAPKFLEQIYEMGFVKMGINYGVDKLRFTSPVPVSSKIKMKAKLLSASSVKNDGIRMRIEATFMIEGEEKPVCVAELLSMVY